MLLNYIEVIEEQILLTLRYSTLTITEYYTVEPLIKDTPNKEHNRNNL